MLNTISETMPHQHYTEAIASALILRVIEGLSTKEAATQLGIKEAALKVRLHRARQELRVRLADYEESEAHR